MNDELLHGLRWVLMSDETGWVEELERVLAPRVSDAAQLEQIRQFLEERLPAADPSHQGRLKGMIRVLADKVAAAGRPAADAFGAAAARWLVLERKAGELAAQLEQVRAEQRAVEAGMRPALLQGARTTGPWRFEADAARPRVRITEPMRVPLDLMRREPDPERVLQRWRETGSAPPGTVVEMEEGGVLVVHEVVGADR